MENLHSSYSSHSTCVWEIPSYSSGPVKAQALQEELVKMLGKGALEIVENSVPGYCSMEGGGWSSTFLASTDLSLTSFKMKTVSSVLGPIRKGDFKLLD